MMKKDKIPTQYVIDEWKVTIPDIKIAIGYCIISGKFEHDFFEISEAIKDGLWITFHNVHCEYECNDKCDVSYRKHENGLILTKGCPKCRIFVQDNSVIILEIKK
jgi:hypothetical protein